MESDSYPNKIIIIELVASLIIGLAIFVYFFPINALDVTQDAWIFKHSGDLTEHYLGWRFFRNSRWLLPLGSVENIGWPDTISVIYLDCIPWMAVLFKIVSPILPHTFQYMGIFELFCFSMQVFVGMEIAKELVWGGNIPSNENIRNKGLGQDACIIILSGILLGVSAPMINRVFYHTALSSHYLLLVAFLIWLKRRRISVKKEMYAWFLLGASCTLSHLFFVPIAGVTLVGLNITDFMLDRSSIKRYVGSIGSYIAGALALFLLLGGFDNTFNPTGVGAGFYGGNLNSLINSMGDSLFIRRLPLATDGQYEGYGYMGMGWILMTIFSLILLYILIIRKQITNYRKLLGFIFGFLCLYIISFAAAAGSIVGINDVVIAEVKYPYLIDLLLNIFRSHGRFVWAVLYLFPVMSLVTVVRYVNRKWMVIVVIAACSVMQLVDLWPARRTNADWFDGYNPYMEDTSSWDEVKRTKWNISFLPGGLDYSQHNRLFEIADMAADSGMTIDNYYYARPRDEYVREKQRVLKNYLDLGYLYDNLFLVLDDVFEPRGRNWQLHFYNINNIVFGSGKEIRGLEEINYEYGIPVDITLKRNVEYGEVCDDDSVILDQGGSISGPEWRLRRGGYNYIVTCDDPENTALLYNSNINDGYITEIKKNVVSDRVVIYSFKVEQDSLGMTLFVRNDSPERKKFYRAVLQEYDY